MGAEREREHGSEENEREHEREREGREGLWNSMRVFEIRCTWKRGRATKRVGVMGK